MFIADGKGGHQRLVPVSNRFFPAAAAYLHGERPAGADTDQVFVVLKGPRRGFPLSASGLDEIFSAATRRAGLTHATCHELRHTWLYLEQIACILRPGSVTNTDQALPAFAGFLAESAPAVTSTAQVRRRHIEDFQPWLANRPGQNKPRATTATLAHPLGTLRRMFFVRIHEWGWEEAPPPPSCCEQRRTTSDCWSGSPSKYCCAPGYAAGSTPACAPTPSC